MIAFAACRSGRAPSASIDLGLELLLARRKPGERFTVRDIAAWCDCSNEYISAVERRALQKLRAALRRGERPLREELSDTQPEKMEPEPFVLPAKTEIPLKEWARSEAERCGVQPGAIYMRMYRHPELKPPMRRVNGRVLMVQIAA